LLDAFATSKDGAKKREQTAKQNILIGVGDHLHRIGQIGSMRLAGETMRPSRDNPHTGQTAPCSIVSFRLLAPHLRWMAKGVDAPPEAKPKSYPKIAKFIHECKNSFFSTLSSRDSPLLAFVW